MQISNKISICKSQIRFLNVKSYMRFLYAKPNNKNKHLLIIQDLQPFLKTDKKFELNEILTKNHK
jgi:hypothetical protein